MRGGSSLTHDLPQGIDWRPLLASLCMHFAIAVTLALLLSPPLEPFPSPSISLAQVTLISPTDSPNYLESAETDPRDASDHLRDVSEDTATLPGDEEAPLTVAAASLAALSKGDGSQIGFGPGKPLVASASSSTPSQTPQGRGLFMGPGGNTAADEKLMEKDIERYLASQPPSGPSTEVTLFGGKLTGHSFVFVIDRSASTASKHYSACADIEKQCALAIEELPAENRFQVVLYNDRISLTNGLRMATKVEKEGAKDRMIRFSPSGGTMHIDALRAALLLRANVVCWFSDGGDPYLSPREVENLALLAARSKTTIHAWRLGKSPENAADDFMRALAEKTGGEFYEGIPTSR